MVTYQLGVMSKTLFIHKWCVKSYTKNTFHGIIARNGEYEIQLYFNDFCVYVFRCFHFYFNKIANQLYPQMFVTTIENFFGLRLKDFILRKKIQFHLK